MRKILLLFAMLLGFSYLAICQTKTIAGQVTDETGSIIPFASVVIKGSKVGVSADANGSYSILARDNETLVFSAAGFKTLEIRVGNKTEINAILTTDSRQMEGVIVTGVAGATQKEKMTVSVTKIGADRLNQVPATSLSSALTGKVAGVKATSYGGLPGQSIDIQLRADNNLNNVSSSPLILVDGVIMTGSLADINSDDVESMEVVKGAAASALYGSRAANGVIAIITKRGRGLNIDKVAINIRNEYGVQNLTHYLDVANAHPYKLADDWESAKGKYTKYVGVTYPANYVGAGFSTEITGNRAIDADHYMDNPYGVNRNQQAEFFGSGHNYTNFISVSNRTNTNNVYASFENNKQTGVVALTDGYQRQNFRLNLDQQITKWLKFSASNLYILRNVQTPGGGVGLFYAIARQERDVNLGGANPDGQPYYLRANHFNQEATNPLYPLWKVKNFEKTNRWLGNYNANIRFTSWVNMDLAHSIEMQNYRFSGVTPKDFWVQSGGPKSQNYMSYNGGGMNQSTSLTNNQNTQVTLNLSQKVGDLVARAKLSYLYENRKYESNYISSSKFVVKDIESFENFATINDASSYSEIERAQNYFAILNLDFRSKLLFDGMFRYDGSSLFGPDARWNPYYRLSGAYRISQDVTIPGIDELKIRAAHGTAGIRPGYNWQYEVYSLSNGIASAQQKGNAGLKPSKTSETEVGLNVNFLKKFTFEATYANSITDDQFLNVPLIPFLNDGFNRQWQNAGSVKSKTLELTLGANWLTGSDFTWNTNIVFSKIRQNIEALPIPPYLYDNGNMGDQSLFYVKAGEVYGVMYGYKFVRNLDEMSKQLPAGKAITDYIVNSDGYVVPAGSEGKATELPIRVKENGADWYGKVGDGNPDFNMGLSNTIAYKGLSLYFLLDYKKGGDIYNGKDQRLAFNYTSARMDMSNVDPAKKKTYDYWAVGMYDKNDINAYWVEDGTYLKLRELALGYSIPSKHLNKFLKGTFKGVTLKAIGRNLLTFTKYSGYDPEVGSLRMPYDGIYMNPNYRNIAFSLSFDF